MEKEEVIPAVEDRRSKVFVDEEDVLARVLKVPEGYYECLRVNSSWPDKGLVEGDIVLCVDGYSSVGGDIVVIEQGGEVRLGLLAEPGWLETPSGQRPLDPDEQIVGVGLVLTRKIRKNL